MVNLTIDLLALDQKKVRPITADNGQEFTEHQHIAQALRTHVFFAHPYHSWERGLNENINGLMRQYFPKGDSLEKVSNKKRLWSLPLSGAGSRTSDPSSA